MSEENVVKNPYSKEEIEKAEKWHLCEYKNVSGKWYYISTCYLFDYYETMVFNAKMSTVRKNLYVGDWKEIYWERYLDEDDAVRGHKRVCDNIEEILKECLKNVPKETK